MKIAISGSNGLIGSALYKALDKQGHTLLRLVRNASEASDKIHWEPSLGIVGPDELNKLENSDALIHLAGKSLAGRWSASGKKEMVSSRVEATKALVESLKKLANPPKLFICASAIGFYGSRADEILTEESTQGAGFLAGLCGDWESAADSAGDICQRVVTLRTSLVLAVHATAMKKMLLPFRLGLGGKLGSGEQYMSWILLSDLVRAIELILRDEDIIGAVNLCAPHPVSNKDFTTALAGALHRPAFFSVPAFVLRAALGEQADELLLSSARVVPNKLLQSGFRFTNETIDGALASLL